jgi:hypothetical protein
LFHIVWQSVGRVKRSVPVSNRVLALTGTSLRFFTRPTLIFYLRKLVNSFAGMTNKSKLPFVYLQDG